LNRTDAESTEEEEVEVFRRCICGMMKERIAVDGEFGDAASMKEQFEQAHRQRYGFIVEEKALIVEQSRLKWWEPMCQMKQ